MDAERIILLVIIGVVMAGIPILLGRLTGQNPFEILFGGRIKGTLFEKKGSGKDEKSPGKTGNGKKEAVQKNSSRQELMVAISDLLSYGRRNRFYCLVPGTVMHEDQVASLAVIMVTRESVLGFNCFGYGGTICAASGDEPWKQILNGEEKEIESPMVRNRKQKEILDAVLAECGYPNIRTEIYGVFTAQGVILKDHRTTRCCSQKALMEILKGHRYLEDRGVEPRKVGSALEPHIKKKA